ncbi:MAG: pyruvate dehydrogenase (acetyl-transferring) E1 component subunit alpha [Pseudomonadota bacterium]
MATATRRKTNSTTRRTAAAKKPASKASKKPKVATEQLLAYYRDMLMIRRFEEKAGQLYGMGLIGGFCHLYIGQEAVAVGIQHALKDGDSVITGYRDHGHMLVCEMDPAKVMAELTGRAGGYSKGKGGSMHMFARDKGFYGGHGIVGAQVPLGTGLGFAHKYRDDGGVAVVYMGDGAVNQGQVYEAFNMASLWKLPVVYVIENNQYGMGTSVKRASANTELYRRGSAYDIPGEQIDGMDVVAVRMAADEAVAHARDSGPILLEAMTYRYRGHSMSDPAKYRSREEVQETRAERDPIDRLRTMMLNQKLVDEDQLKGIDKDIRAIVNDAATYAQDSPEPAPEELYTDVYVDA